MVRIPVESVSILEDRATFICAEEISGIKHITELDKEEVEDILKN